MTPKYKLTTLKIVFFLDFKRNSILLPYLTTMVKNEVINYLKREKHQPNLQYLTCNFHTISVNRFLELLFG